MWSRTTASRSLQRRFRLRIAPHEPDSRPVGEASLTCDLESPPLVEGHVAFAARLEVGRPSLLVTAVQDVVEERTASPCPCMWATCRASPDRSEGRREGARSRSPASDSSTNLVRLTEVPVEHLGDRDAVSLPLRTSGAQRAATRRPQRCSPRQCKCGPTGARPTTSSRTTRRDSRHGWARRDRSTKTRGRDESVDQGVRICSRSDRTAKRTWSLSGGHASSCLKSSPFRARPAARSAYCFGRHLCVDLDPDLLAYDDATCLERLVVGEAPVLAVDLCGRLEAERP